MRAAANKFPHRLRLIAPLRTNLCLGRYRSEHARDHPFFDRSIMKFCWEYSRSTTITECALAHVCDENDNPVFSSLLNAAVVSSPRTAKAHSDALRQKLGVPRRRQIPAAYRKVTGEDPLRSALDGQ